MPTQNSWAWVGMGMGTQCRAMQHTNEHTCIDVAYSSWNAVDIHFYFYFYYGCCYCWMNFVINDIKEIGLNQKIEVNPVACLNLDNKNFKVDYDG